jgi:hypothetical protein
MASRACSGQVSIANDTRTRREPARWVAKTKGWKVGLWRAPRIEQRTTLHLWRPPAAQPLRQLLFTLITFGLIFSALGNVSVKTPSLNAASALSIWIAILRLRIVLKGP